MTDGYGRQPAPFSEPLAMYWFGFLTGAALALAVGFLVAGVGS
ncbi:MAG TPA: hypothetical protein VGX00_08870 [Thermoplasmata archaeon]|nr:hypothetical protein [Thermoplasmata archaeon]